MSVVLAPEAVDDLAAAVDYLTEHRPDAADRFIDRAFDLFRALDQREFEGPVQRLRDGSETRSWPLPPYRVYYRRSDAGLVVLRVYHQARRPL